jgi:hypothetical protein
MSESLAWYYALKVAEHAREPGYLERLRSYLRQPETMAPIRRGEPLLRGLDQYMSYRKGPFALYALSEYVGEEQINGALRRLRDNHRKPSAPLATTLDLYRELQVVTPDSLRYLLRDLFEVNTFWELKTERATAAQTTAGTWLVALAVQARKVVVDSAGVETEVPMDDWVEVGVFAPAEKGQPSDQPLYLQKHRLRSGPQTITVPVPRKPTRAGLDPHHLLIDLRMEDNLKDIGS